MLREVCITLLIAVLSLGLAASALAQDESPAEEPQAPPETVVEAPEPAVAQPTSAAELFDRDLLAVLAAQWGPVDRDEPEVTDGGNVTILSVPEGYALYLAAVGEIQGAEQGGAEVTVEDVVFTESHYLGTTPLTVALPRGDYVLAARATMRQGGFDGGCVMKTTFDVITGGRRHAYHLYPLRKQAGQYQCFVANFAPGELKVEDVGEALAVRGTFAVPEGDLIGRLGRDTHAPADELERLARRLNQLGVAFYRAGGSEFLIKLGLAGNDYEIKEWPVE